MTDNEHGWSLVLTQGDRSIEYRWEEQIFWDKFFERSESRGYMAQLFDAKTGEPFHSNESSEADALGARVILAATTFRRSEVRSEPQWPTEWELIQDPRALDAAMLQLFERSMRSEYLGQRSGNLYLFVQDVAEILAVPLEDAIEAADRLAARKLLSLDGRVLVERTEEDEEDHFEPCDRRATGADGLYADSTSSESVA